jgi:hypothetical protein
VVGDDRGVVSIVDLAGQKKVLTRECTVQITPSDPSGTVTNVLLTPDGRTAVYTIGRKTSDLYMVTGLR